MGKLDGKVAIITGATLVESDVGIGGATARAMVRAGARVVVADLDGAGVERLAAELNRSGRVAVGCQLDLSIEDAVRRVIETAVREFGGIDNLHNNASGTTELDHDVESMDVAIWDGIMAVDLRGAMLTCKYAIPIMRNRGGGAIVNTSSADSLAGDVTRTAYGAAKAGLNNLTRYVATQYGKYGIRCNAVCPGFMLTRRAKISTSAEQKAILGRHNLLPTRCQPEEVANAVVFLASDDASAITGQIIPVDKGLLSHLSWYADFEAMAAASAKA